MNRLLGRSANAEVMSAPLSWTRTLAGAMSAGSTTSTRASPPEMRSGRFEITSIRRSVAGAAAASTAPPATSNAARRSAQPDARARDLNCFIAIDAMGVVLLGTMEGMMTCAGM